MGFGRSVSSSLMILTIMLLSCCLVPVQSQISVPDKTLMNGFYSLVCPVVESVVRTTVTAYFKLDPSIASGLLKLHILDCFVEGCDGSVLLSGPNNTNTSASSNLSLRGFEVIEDIKKQLEELCPATVSCADILALAARDSVLLTDGPNWDVKLGRRDGRVSLPLNAEAFHIPSYSDFLLIQAFTALGINITDTAAIIGNVNLTNLQKHKAITGNFKIRFANAMVKVSEIGVKTGANGEIRTNCSTVN